MEKYININGQNIAFEYVSTAHCWRSMVTIDKEQIEVEIDFQFHKEEIVDWNHLTSFIRFISKPNRLKEYVDQTKVLTLNFAKTRARNSEEVNKWETRFSKSIFYNGKNGSNYLFSLIYHFNHPTQGFGDDYGLYLADFNSNNLLGVRRHQ